MFYKCKSCRSIKEERGKGIRSSMIVCSECKRTKQRFDLSAREVEEIILGKRDREKQESKSKKTFINNNYIPKSSKHESLFGRRHMR